MKFPIETLQRALEQYRDKNVLTPSLPGYSVLITQDNKITFEESFGVRHGLIQEETNSKTAPFCLCSISKVFIGHLFTLLDLEQPGFLNKELSEFFKSYEKVSLRDLLNHTSGISDYYMNENYKVDICPDYNLERVLDFILTHCHRDEANKSFLYSNSNFVLLSKVLEVIYDKNWWEVVYEYVTYPYGLENTFALAEKEVSSDFAFGSWMGKEGDLWVNPCPFEVGWGDSGLVSTLVDLQKLPDIFTDEVRDYHKAQLLKRGESAAYSNGLQVVMENNQIKSFSHAGGGCGTHTYFSYFPEQRITITSYANHFFHNSRTEGNNINAILSTLF